MDDPSKNKTLYWHPTLDLSDVLYPLGAPDIDERLGEPLTEENEAKFRFTCAPSSFGGPGLRFIGEPDPNWKPPSRLKRAQWWIEGWLWQLGEWRVEVPREIARRAVNVWKAARGDYWL